LNWIKASKCVITSRSFPHSWLITGFVTRLTRRVSLVEQELLTLRSTWVHTRFLVGLLYFFWILVYHFVLFLLVIVLSVLLRYTDSDCPFGIFKLFLEKNCVTNDNRHVPFVVVTITSISTFRGLSSDFEQEWHDGVTSGTRTTYPSELLMQSLCFIGVCVAQSLVFLIQCT
jgi:hypothetical protein